MKETMQALMKQEPGRGMSLERIEVPNPARGEVRLRVRSVGIDGGAEALIYDWHPSKRSYEKHLPQLFGHEFSGEVDSVGEDVTRVNPGDRVAVEPLLACGSCRNCLEGQYNICESDERRIFGLNPAIDGALSEYTTVPEANLYLIDDEVTYDEGTFLELLGLGVHGVERSSLRPGDTVAISGPGSVGLSTLIAAKKAGASTITMFGAAADAESRLNIAREIGATETVNVAEKSFDGEVDIFFECSGAPSALDAAVEHTRNGGEIIQIGVYHEPDMLSPDLNQLIRSEIDWKTVYGRKDSSWRRAMAIVKDEDLSPVIRPTFDFEEYESAFDAVLGREGIKVTLHP